MNKEDQKLKFTELRIKGDTFESIAKQLKVSKQTLINWSKCDEVKETISTSKMIKYQNLLRTYDLSRDSKIEHLATLAKKAKEELLNRDLSNVPTEKLVNLFFSLTTKLKEEIPTYTYGGELPFGAFLDAKPSFTFNPED